MNQSRTIPAHILVSIRVRGNLAYVSAKGFNKAKNIFEKQVHREILEARVLAFLKVISEGSAYDIDRVKKGIV